MDTLVTAASSSFATTMGFSFDSVKEFFLELGQQALGMGLYVFTSVWGIVLAVLAIAVGWGIISLIRRRAGNI